jgi:hypothetical protein
MQPTPGLITREHHFTRGSLRPWGWLYRVYTETGDDVAIGTRMSEAVDWAKRRGLTPIKAWDKPK